MSIASDIIGTRYRYHDYFLVGREKIREYARLGYQPKVKIESGIKLFAEWYKKSHS